MACICRLVLVPLLVIVINISSNPINLSIIDKVALIVFVFWIIYELFTILNLGGASTKSD